LKVLGSSAVRLLLAKKPLECSFGPVVKGAVCEAQKQTEKVLLSRTDECFADREGKICFAVKGVWYTEKVCTGKSCIWNYFA